MLLSVLSPLIFEGFGRVYVSHSGKASCFDLMVQSESELILTTKLLVL